jgi:broad specificity phosphatase PhoE
VTSELFLVRHAQASFGSGNYDRLSELGHRQARWLGEHFRSRRLAFDRVICGHMVRHRETVEGIFHGMGQDFGGPDLDPNWNEFDFEAIVGAYLELHPDQRPAPGASVGSFSRLLRNALQAWTEDRLAAPLPERWRQFEERVRQGLNATTAQPGDGRRILLVSSGGAIATALSHVLQAPPGAMVHMNLQLRNSSVSHLYFNQRAVHFAGFNHVPHLDHPDRAGSVTYY